MCALNMENPRIHAGHLDIELAMAEKGSDALSEILESIDLADSASFIGAKIHPVRHLICNILGVTCVWNPKSQLSI